MAKQDDYVRYTIRIPRWIYTLVENSAGEHTRSINAEIIENLTYAHSDEAKRDKDLIDELRHDYFSIRERLDDALQSEKLMIDLAASLEKIRQLNLNNFILSIKQILLLRDNLPKNVADYCDGVLKIYEDEIKNLDPDNEPMKHILEQAKKLDTFTSSNEEAGKVEFKPKNQRKS
ncbi:MULTISPECIES: Arc family DNA-binding protein [Rhizobium/Agrobacterium group]|uniref:Arc-like DNA binding domain-containing protein n=2 Tax=Rhizobium/Agrobacterium group TaxID=227290 RepID=B9JSC8_ALLAM|nr:MULTISPECIES: Arc family DNA-binding protein [Rhizobium/Agrobacterium group]ACM35621.1 hypothetical protein Avi_0880 [Allorhizobium ampelinum S4]MUO29440.1 Arc family DNA-binding protein [Agrobacterium vitis]MUO42615.1 Arc family DNA-binding protein [Agrobacterium vitis]MUP10584.1 Arc family DNA-binding protein [Agrobacterium vitis]